MSCLELDVSEMSALFVVLKSHSNDLRPSKQSLQGAKRKDRINRPGKLTFKDWVEEKPAKETEMELEEWQKRAGRVGWHLIQERKMFLVGGNGSMSRKERSAVMVC